MGRIILFALVVVALVLVWKAFGPQSWKRPPEPRIKGPDDDPDFLWELDKKRFKEQQRKLHGEDGGEESGQTKKRKPRNGDTEGGSGNGSDSRGEGLGDTKR